MFYESQQVYTFHNVLRDIMLCQCMLKLGSIYFILSRNVFHTALSEFRIY